MPKIEIPLENCLRLIAHGPVTLITTEANGVPNVAACSWIMPAAAVPPLLALSLGMDSLTRSNIDSRGEFVVNIPPRRLARAIDYCGRASGRDVRKAREAGLRLEPAGRVRAPWITEAIGHLECAARQAHGLGGHVLVVAEVVLAAAEARLFDGAWITDDPEGRTLHHLGGDHYASIGRRVEIDPKRPFDWPPGA
jgi:flavin reductase (DIM6/NTAB) family NADH-FMN oxidoreductase RutF